MQTEHLAPPPGDLPDPSLSLEENLGGAKALNLGLGREVQLLRRQLVDRPWRQARADDIGTVHMCPSGKVWHYSRARRSLHLQSVHTLLSNHTLDIV